MAGSSWTNQLLNLIILSAAQKGFSGFFVYSPAPGPGNLIGSWAAAAGVDPYGNAYPAGLSVESGSFTGIDLFLYNGAPAAGNLLASITSAAGTDAEGNHYLAGVASYGTNFANAMIGGALLFYTGSQAAGWTFAAQVETDASGDLLLSASGTIVMSSGNFSVDSSGNVTMGPDLNLTPAMGAISGYPFATITVANSGGAWGANVDGVVNALVAGVNQLIGEQIGRGMIA
jgi:hypothetical protein